MLYPLLNFLKPLPVHIQQLCKVHSTAKHTAKQVKKYYTSTLNLPETKLVLSVKDGAALQREQHIQQEESFSTLYSWQSEQLNRSLFTLHDGPPYANGDIHVGHALNKLLKDFTCRYKVLRGQRVQYRPGWDCHGLPIEQKALESLRQNFTSMEPLEIRSKARQFAQSAVTNQKATFQKLGIMADWDHSYHSYDRSYQVKQLQAFHEMFEKGVVYKEYMPVFWSPSSRTALAEAELEYNEHHISTSVYVKFVINDMPSELTTLIGTSRIYALIWTTTPWTLPVNQAICYGANVTYALVRPDDQSDVYIISENFIEKIAEILDTKLTVLTTFKGTALSGCHYTHPLKSSDRLPLLAGHHVTNDKGTGLVHTAPAHGQEDFQIAVNNGLTLECLVDESGCYSPMLGTALAGKHVLDEGNSLVLGLLKDSIVHSVDFQHSYPYDWRTKKPVIYRASQQWFINTESLSKRAMECLNSVSIFPATSSQGMVSQLERRTYWCISRQRSWGLPIPVFYNQETHKPLINQHTMKHIQNLFSEHGSDCWWTMSMDQLLPKEVKQLCGILEDSEFYRGRDVFDIWFDSGVSWMAVLDDGNEADLYLEGVDQFGGWFQSSLITSVAIRNKAPYKSLIVHGFAMDENGRKMSKSLGNVIDPKTVIHGAKNRQKFPSHGVDVLRWWAAWAGLDPAVNIGPNILAKCTEQIFKVRKSLRYLLGNLSDYTHNDDAVSYEQLLPQDKLMLHQLHILCNKVEDSYEDYNYRQVVKLLEVFINRQVSSYYCHVTKDRLYCSPSCSLARRSSQTAIYHMLSVLCATLAPILPHLTEEVFKHYNNNADVDSIFKSTWDFPKSEWYNEDLGETFNVINTVKELVNSTIDSPNPSEYDVTIYANQDICDMLKVLQDTKTSCFSCLNEFLQTAQTTICDHNEIQNTNRHQCIVSYGNNEHSISVALQPACGHMCERCRRKISKLENQLCERCQNVMDHKIIVK